MYYSEQQQNNEQNCSQHYRVQEKEREREREREKG